LGLGVAGAGFDHAAVVEWDRWACETLKDNKPWPVTQGDVRLVSYDGLGTIDLVSGGPPCQPFSLGGKHNAHLDHRDMFPEAIRAVRELRPRAFVFENVKGLTRATFQNYLSYIRLQLAHPEVTARPDEPWIDHLGRLERHETSGSNSGLRYNVVLRLLNAANHGVPQRRERIFLVGFRSDLGVEWRFPDETHSSAALAWSLTHEDEYFDRHRIGRTERRLLRDTLPAIKGEKPTARPWLTVRDAFLGLPDPELDPRGAKGIP
ncbi:DNA cytosine methyltransferase, partial [Lactiplantibacillus plantarum]|nr:DNA cytosine methyltransferase [Lactiplantibacillus plantarum]